MNLFKTFEIVPAEEDFNQSLLDEMQYVLSIEAFAELEIPLEFVQKLDVEFKDGTIVSLKEELELPYPSTSNDVLSEQTKAAFNKHIKGAKLYIYTNALQQHIDDRLDAILNIFKDS